MNSLKEQLREFGFSEKETAIYMTLLGLGSGVASDVAKKSKINRSTAYVVLESLAGRGLVGVIERRGVRIYQATSPEKLVEHLETAAKRYSQFAANAKKLMPELRSIYHPDATRAREPKVHFFEGQKQLKTVYEDTLGSLEGIRAYASVESAGAKDQKAKVQVIFPNTKEAKAQITETKEAGEQALKLPAGKMGFASEINIYDEKVIFISPGENFGLIIESKEFADTLKKAFVAGRREIEKGGKAEGKRLAEGF